MNELEAAIKRATIGRTFSNGPKPALKMDQPTAAHVYPKVLDIKRAVADYFSIEVHDLDCGCRRVNAVKPRHFAMYLCRRLTLHSSAEIGRRFGGRDRTTVNHAVDRIEKLVSGTRRWNQEAREQIAEIKSAIYQGPSNGQTK